MIKSHLIPIKKFISKHVFRKPIHICTYCNKKVNKFDAISINLLQNLDKHSFIHSIFQFETLNFLNYSCPKCGASDRVRLYVLYFKRFSPFLFNKFYSVLEIAPDKYLKSFLIKTYPQISYITADLNMEGVDDKVDITNMSIYKDNMFDFIICSHVLEHVEDDKIAIYELYRVLKSGGKGIVMVPIILNLANDYECDSVLSDNDRWSHFGQNDHVRIYSKNGFITKLKTVGFEVNELGIDEFGADEFKKNGIHFRSKIYIVEK